MAAPRELEICFEWQRTHTPYHAGGQVDQPFALLHRMRAAHNVYTAIRAWKDSQNWNELQRQEPELWSIIETVIQLREELQHGR